MAGNQQQLWSEMLCCPGCKKVYSKQHLPVTLYCSHLLCLDCVKQDGFCPFDKNEAKWDDSSSSKLFINGPVLSISLCNEEAHTHQLKRSMKSLCVRESSQYCFVEQSEGFLYELANFLYKVDSEKGATVASNKISRTIQRRLLSLLCINLWREEGCSQLIYITRSMCERIVSELILCIQCNANLSSSLWTAVRGRGCQFLGPAMQEDVLKLILHTLKNGELIARKTLVLYVVETLTADYHHISKTCVGHVVQLLYRASCFNVIKREGESSLMQLKEQFREYDALRAEHDAQIVQIAMEAGLRISPDQWSSLLYGDSRHRTYMQSVCDRLSNNSLQNAVDELRNLVSQQPPDRNLFGIQTIFEHFDALVKENLDSSDDKINWLKIRDILSHLLQILKIYSKFIMNRNVEREQRIRQMPTVRKTYGMLRERACPDVNGSNMQSSTESDNHRYADNYYLQKLHNTGRMPLRSVNTVQHHPLHNPPFEFGGVKSNGMAASSLYYPPAQPPRLSSYLEQQPFPIGTPPGFLVNGSASPTRYPPTANKKETGSVGPMNQQHLQIDSMEAMPGQFIPLLPTHQIMQTYVEPITTTANNIVPTTIVPTTACGTSPVYADRPSILLFANNSNPSEGTTIMNAGTLIASTQPTTTTLYSTSPPNNYQITPGGLVATPAFSIPVQTQPVILYGSTPPFGSPPLLISQFANWTTPMDAGAFVGGAGFFNLNPGNNATSDKSSHNLCETSYESEEDQANNEKGKRGRKSSRALTEEDDSECHVSFTVANSVLHGHDDSEHSIGSAVGWNLELPPLPVGQLNLPIPLSPSNVTYTVARDSAQPSLCTIIRTCNAAGAPASLIPQLQTMPIVQELSNSHVENLPVS